MWLWFERRRIHGAILTLQGVNIATDQRFDTLTHSYDELRERIEAVENPATRAANEQGERAKIATRLRLDPRYQHMDDNRFEAAVEQLYGALVKQRPRDRA